MRRHVHPPNSAQTSARNSVQSLTAQTQMHGVKKTFRADSGTPRATGLGLRSTSSRAFSILEVMVAAAVMALAITTSITTMQRGFLSLDTARNITIAGQIMQCEIEKMRMVPWADINAYATSPTSIPIDSSFTTNPAVGSRFSLSRNAAVIATSTGIGMREITFTVAWKNYDGRSISRSYTAYYGQNGLYDYYFNSI